MPYFGVTPAAEFTSKDLNGSELILDADADTTITADTDDQIDIRIAGADDFQFTANTFTAQSGSTIAAQALTGTTGVFSSDVTGLTLNATGDTAASDNAAIGYTSAEGLILTGQGSTNDITIKRDDDTAVLEVATGQSDIEVTGGNIFFGTAGKGICLGATSYGAANTLHDYEEGLYDVAVTNATSGSYGLASGYDSFSYTKVGRLVTVLGTVNIDSESSPNGQIQVSLPFTALATAEYADSYYSNCFVVSNNADGDTDANITAWVIGGATILGLYQHTHGTGAAGSFDHTDADAAFSISIMFSYLAA